MATYTRSEVIQRDGVTTEPAAKVYQKKKTIFRVYQVIWYVLGLVEVLLAFRIFLKMLGANPNSCFANFIYAVTDPLALPFAGIFRTTVSRSETTVSVVEWSTFIAMIVYLLLAYAFVKFFQLIKPTNPEEVEGTVDSQ
jgi:hypothetical protein